MAENEKITLEDVLSVDTDLEKRIVRDFSQLKSLVSLLKKEGHRIVLTQGVWDLIHEGHAKYLEKAKSHGDILIVGVDSDELTRQRKGPNRPIVPEDERLNMISHLRSVDLITVRECHHDIGDLIRMVEPDVLVVSKTTKDFTTKLKQEYSPVCGDIVDLAPQATTHTSERIRQLTIDGAEQLAKEVKELADQFINKIKSEK